MSTLNRWARAQRAIKEFSWLGRVKDEPNEPDIREELQAKFGIDSSVFADKVVCEVGCGPFGPIYYIGGPRLAVGVDPIVYHTRHLRSKVSPALSITGGGEHLPFKDGTFDIIICFNVLDYCRDGETVIREMKRTLNEGGLVLLWTPTFGIPGWVRSAVGLVDTLRPHHFGRDELPLLLKESGFEVIYERVDRLHNSSWFLYCRRYGFYRFLKTFVAENLMLGRAHRFVLRG